MGVISLVIGGVFTVHYYNGVVTLDNKVVANLELTTLEATILRNFLATIKPKE